MYQRAGRTMKRTHLKRLQLGRAPAALCIHMNRTVWLADGSLVKNNQHMRFPVQLDASALLKGASTTGRHSGGGGITGGGGGVMYVLCAVVEHEGGPNSGHYVTYRRCGGAGIGDGRGTGGRGNWWVCASDTAVYSASLDEVLGAEAYMLFYSRKREHKSNSPSTLSP